MFRSWSGPYGTWDKRPRILQFYADYFICNYLQEPVWHPPIPGSPAGAVVDNLPEGGEEIKISDQTYVKYGETYYQPVKVDDKEKYEVVQVEQGE